MVREEVTKIGADEKEVGRSLYNYPFIDCKWEGVLDTCCLVKNSEEELGDGEGQQATKGTREEA